MTDLKSVGPQGPCGFKSHLRYMKVGDEVQLQVYGEICCDDCGEVVHNHIDCPVCRTAYAATDRYHNLYEDMDLTCEECGTVFVKVSESWYDECTVRITSMK